MLRRQPFSALSSTLCCSVSLFPTSSVLVECAWVPNVNTSSKAEDSVSYFQHFDRLCISSLSAPNCTKKLLWIKIRVVYIHGYIHKY